MMGAANFFAFLIGGAIGFLLGWYTGKYPGWTAPIVAWIKSRPWKKK
jgi:hypothetical protein